MKKLLLTLLLLMLPVISLCETPDTLITPRDRSLEPLLTQMPDADASRWHDVTPPALDGMDWRIYKHRETFEALLLTADGLAPLGTGFGGIGVTSAAPCAAPDGSPALLVTYSWGSGIHRAILAFYHPGTQQLTGLAVYWPAREEPSEMVILPPTLHTETPFSSYAIAEYPVWLAEVSILSSTDFTLVKPVGTVTENHGLHVDLDLTQWQP